MAGRSEQSSGGESTGTVLVALGANALVAVAKGAAAVLTGSSAMASEAAHSVADTVKEVFLLVALRRSGKPADRTHPLGYGQDRYFWALMAAGSIFVTGALFSAYRGIESLLSGGSELSDPLVSYVVLAVAFLLEGTSLARGVVQTRRESREHGQPFRAFLRTTDDPTVTTVVFEDSAALVGLLLAAAGVALHQLTGEAVYDGIASILIAVLLALVAVRLGRTNMRLLTDTQADPRLVRAILAWLGDQPEVEAVVDLLTVQLGTDAVLVCARLDTADGFSSREVERAMMRMDEGVRAQFPDVAEVFLEPVPRDDRQALEWSRARLGRDRADRMVHEAASGAQPSRAETGSGEAR